MPEIQCSTPSRQCFLLRRRRKGGEVKMSVEVDVEVGGRYAKIVESRLSFFHFSIHWICVVETITVLQSHASVDNADTFSFLVRITC